MNLEINLCPLSSPPITLISSKIVRSQTIPHIGVIAKLIN